MSTISFQENPEPTIREAVENLLESKGVWGEYQEQVMQLVVEKMPEITGRWNDKVSRYHARFVPVIEVRVNKIVADWMVENYPGHFAYPMFVS